MGTKKPRNLKELEKWIEQNPQRDEQGTYLMSRYQALKKLFGQDKADHVLRQLEVESWDFSKMGGTK